jgi:phosphoribosylformylglycinamidine (FGAM) synthase-like enzyme
VFGSNIPNDDKQMSPLEVWCNESQERYVLAISDESLRKFLLATLGSCNILVIASSNSIVLASKALRLMACGQ